MAVVLKSKHEIELMEEAGKRLSETLMLLKDNVKPGITTFELDQIGRRHIEGMGCIPSFLNYNGFPASICISVNDEVVHGIPSKRRVLKEGDIVSLDAGLIYRGFHADAARTYPVGSISEEAQKLIDVTKQSFFEGIAAIGEGKRIGDIGYAIQSYVEANGFSVVREYIGHGIGKNLHEDPEVPNYGNAGHGQRIRAGMTIAIEPMVNQGDWRVKVLSDKWTVVTVDGKLSAHYENTVAVTENGVLILTDPA